MQHTLEQGINICSVIGVTDILQGSLYIDSSQKILREEINEENTRISKKRVNEIKSEGGAKSGKFWRLRKKLLGKKSDTDYNTITEEGKELTDPDETKEYIATYYENLYQAREGLQQYEK